MAYERKTVDEFVIEQYTGPQYGWEAVNTEDNRTDARRSLREYRENQPEYPARWRKRRVKKETP